MFNDRLVRQRPRSDPLQILEPLLERVLAVHRFRHGADHEPVALGSRGVMESRAFRADERLHCLACPSGTPRSEGRLAARTRQYTYVSTGVTTGMSCDAFGVVRARSRSFDASAVAARIASGQTAEVQAAERLRLAQESDSRIDTCSS